MGSGLCAKKTVAALVLALGLAVQVSTASARSGGPRPLVLDAHSATSTFFTPPVSSSSKLVANRLYVATVQGTVSFYQSADYIALQAPWHVMCGAPQRAPMFSSGGGSGQVGNDAEFVFAQPLVGDACAKTKLPRPYTNFQINLGHSWRHPSVLSPRKLSRTHTYEFALIGADKPVSFRLIDPDTHDDYGSLLIRLRRAVIGDCAGRGYRAFGVSRSACLATAAKGPAPGLPAAPPVLTLDQTPLVRVLRNSDVPKAMNQEVPSGALGASPFANLDNSSSSAAAAETALVRAHGYRSAAISEFAGPGMPSLKSTVVKLSSPQEALATLQGEVTLAAADQAPAGTSVTVAPDNNLNQTFIITFTPSAGGTGGLELLASAGDYLYTLKAVEKPDAVSRAAEEQLLGLLLSRH
jgi:hypothetical protein